MKTIFDKIFTKAFLVTIFRYALVAVGAWLASNTGFDPGTWETISGALMVIVIAIMGGAEATTDKVTYNGQTVKISDMTATKETEVKKAVNTTPKRSAFDMLFGK